MEATSKSVLSVDGLRKRYGRTEALRGLSFSVPEGSFFGLFGRNGAGKTTTLDIVTGLLARDSGRIVMLGENVRAEPEPETKDRFGYVAGHLQLYDWMTCREHIDFLAKFYSTWDRDREEQLLRLFRLPLNQRVGTLSAGQHVQLQLLMALPHHPELLLIDEPGNLDAVVRQRLMDTLIGAIAEERTTVVMASHILSELDRVCDHLCIIDRGATLTSGPLDALVDSVRRVHYQGVKALPPAMLSVEGGFKLERRDDEVRVVLPGYTPERTEELAEQLQATGYETERLDLQELFVALTEDRE